VTGLLLDTEVFAQHLRGEVRIEPDARPIHYSTVTRYELLANTDRADHVRTLLAPFVEEPVDSAIAERAGQLARERGLRTIEALITATALERGLSLVMRWSDLFGTRRG